ncbi:maltooligosyltrehalose trehalohydrolase [Endobacter medicaginis]|uniref:Malto-oligosyltrehalose trehalohydrolase n=1 Tax=Endobacter medicaginis TaxID=1181271 RepID=A0A839UTK9_9PROT|nr:malto-oligosyltrehalose trehalohydrolase [Endobacter medicaginis]MBB3173598.1 maltooligosyltrehalose trehalohydrolase [Endobacter medicaginis]MCX5475768.1 malto-oligosyltrehalose trehalohydrolase [Endobacter medicaginis]NVN28991.1 malto-oligosyltrehalose trehalohydrolase [Endobacter medicaginis]
MIRTQHGPLPLGDGLVRFRLWAPAQDRVGLELDGHDHAMVAHDDGWHTLDIAAAPLARYRFVLGDGLRVPDPASRFQPEDVHGPSQLRDPGTWRWRNEWAGRPWGDAVIYELHVGTFSEAGTFLGAIEHLDALAALGITAVQIMPVSDFSGARNWGYDGVLPYAPDSAYGTPDDLKALVDAAHARGLMIFLDVVYNHFGPDGNYLSAYAPQFFTDRHKSPWGDGINVDGEDSGPVRAYILDNVRMWIEEFRFDGLRFDAVHAIKDDSRPHILTEIARVARGCVDRPVHLILENEHNDAHKLERRDGRPITFTAQWNDDVHHVLHVVTTGESAGYYHDYTDRPALLGRAIAEGFAYQGETMPYSGLQRGEPSAYLPPEAFIAFIQNHDQIGNRAFGDRIAALIPREPLRAITAITLLLPQIPMLFMGEEWGCRQPFAFFCDFEGDLADAVRDGRRAEFKKFPEFQDPKQRERIPDPLAESTFLAFRLDRAKADPATLQHYTDLLRVRARCIRPLIDHITHGGTTTALATNAWQVRWQADTPAGRRVLTVQFNLSPSRVTARPTGGRVIWTEGDTLPDLGPWAVRWSVETP